MKTRFAPSPTGLMHLGNVRTALFSALLAYSQKGHFILRIEDTDSARSEQQYVSEIKKDLKWLGLTWQEGPDVGGPSGPYFQSQRSALYEKYYQQLISQGDAYPCFCSEEKLAMMRKAQRAAGQPPRYAGTCRSLTAEEVREKCAQGQKPTLRFALPQNKHVVFEDLVKGVQRFDTRDMGDFIIRRSSGDPAYLFANAVDDATMGVTHSVRGEDHLTNTPRQILLLEALQLPVSHYAHISMIVDQEGNKLSKRVGSFSIQELRADGFLPDAIVNYMARLGHYFGDVGYLPVDELAKRFTTASLSKSAARYDIQQLKYWQKEAVMNADNHMLYEWVKPYLSEVSIPESACLGLIALVKENVVMPQDVILWIERLLTETPLPYNEDALASIRSAGSGFFDAAIAACALNPSVQSIKEATGVKGKQLFQPLRWSLTNTLQGPELGALCAFLGEESIVKRLKQAKACCE